MRTLVLAALVATALAARAGAPAGITILYDPEQPKLGIAATIDLASEQQVILAERISMEGELGAPVDVTFHNAMVLQVLPSQNQAYHVRELHRVFEGRAPLSVNHVQCKMSDAPNMFPAIPGEAASTSLSRPEKTLPAKEPKPARPDQLDTFQYKARDGQRLKDIGRIFDVGDAELQQANPGIALHQMLLEGQLIAIPLPPAENNP
jgi:hypothetical protein